MTSFEAVTIRYAETQTNEFLNMGLVLFSPKARYAGCRWAQGLARITQAFPSADPVALRRLQRAVDDVVTEWRAQQVELSLEPLEKVQQLLSRAFQHDDATVQLSLVISGVTSNAERTLNELFDLYIGKQADAASGRRTRNDEDVWKAFGARLDASVVSRLLPQTVVGHHLKVDFERSWRNGVLNVLQPLSFDHNSTDTIQNKAAKWVGQVKGLVDSLGDTQVHFLVGLPGPDAETEVRTAANDALAFMAETLRQEARVVTEADQDRLAEKIRKDLAHGASEP